MVSLPERAQEGSECVALRWAIRKWYQTWNSALCVFLSLVQGVLLRHIRQYLSKSIRRSAKTEILREDLCWLGRLVLSLQGQQEGVSGKQSLTPHMH